MSITNDLVSVIIPVYKVEKYLKKCVQSVIDQTYSNLEIILVDDGSPDDSGRICDEYKKSDSRIQVIHKKNGGLSDARNYGLNIASGAYVMFVDSDDYIAHDMVEGLIKTLYDANAEMCICRFQYINDKGDPINEKNEGNPIKDEVISGFEAIKRLSYNRGSCYAIACCKLYKTELFQNLRFPVGKLHEDEFVAHLLFAKCNRLASMEKSYYYYLQHSDSIMGRHRTKMSIRDLDSAEAYLERACFVHSIGMKKEAGIFFLKAALMTSLYCVKYKPNSMIEKVRLEEMLSMIKKSRNLASCCEVKGKIHVALICLSPKIHNFFVEVLNK